MKKTLSLLLILSLLIFGLALNVSAATIVASGECGQTQDDDQGDERQYWTLDSEGTLTITGKGRMMNWGFDSAPWPRTQVRKIIIGKGVTSIGDCAFQSCSNLTAVSLPSTLAAINEYAFHGCEKLTGISMPDKVTIIGDSAFSNCRALANIKFPSNLESIGPSAFHGCSGIKELSLPNTLKSLGSNCFLGCINIKKVNLPDSLEVIEESAFENCQGLESIIIPEGITVLPKWAFMTCHSLKSVSLPSSLSSIGLEAFYGCTSLKRITIPAEVTAIDSAALGNCSNLDTIIFKGNAPKFHENAFSSTVTTAFYPRNNTTWTSSVRRDYGGDITWKKQSPLTITTQPETTYTRSGSTAKASVVASGDNLQYQWYFRNPQKTTYSKSSVAVSTYSVTMSDAAKDRLVYCIVTDQYGNSVKSDTVRLRMAATITQQPVNVTAPEGTKATVSLKAVGDGLTYTWYQATADSNDFSKSTTFTGPTYTVSMTQARDGRKVYCVVKDKYGKSVKSDIVTLSISDPIVITKQPKTVYVKNGDNATVSVKATGEKLTYQWYIRNANNAGYSKSSVTTSTYSCKMNSTVKDRLVYCVITDQFGRTVKSDTVRLRMAASITAHPKDTSAADGRKATISVSAMGDGLTYQWYYKDASASKFALTTSFKSTSYSVTMTDARNGRKVYCVVTDKYGNTDTSATVTLGFPVTISRQPKNDYAHSGETAAVTVKANGIGLTYQWYIKDAGQDRYVKSSVTSATYSAKMSSKVRNRLLYCIVTDMFGNTVKTNTVKLCMAVSISKQPANVMVAEGSTATVTVTAMGDGLTYQWYYKSRSATKYSLSTTYQDAYYAIKMTEARDGYNVYCVVTDKYGYSVTSKIVTLSME